MSKDNIHRTIVTVTVLTDGPFHQVMSDESGGDDTDLLNLDYLISEGHGIGMVEVTSTMRLPAEAVHGELIRLGNDGEFFDEVIEEDEEDDNA